MLKGNCNCNCNYHLDLHHYFSEQWTISARRRPRTKPQRKTTIKTMEKEILVAILEEVKGTKYFNNI